ncbi:MAG: hypothetical protein ACI9TH_002866 [Kiritimatiellia bacterium]|jgi:hypothetical protein
MDEPAAGLALGWGLVLFIGYPTIGLVFGFAAVVGGGLFGGYPVSTGTEEFLLGLPPTRTQQVRVRFGMGLLPIVLGVVLSLALLHGNLPQRFWRLFFTSSYTEFYPSSRLTPFAPLCLTIPLCLYSCLAYSRVCVTAARPSAWRFWVGAC